MHRNLHVTVVLSLAPHCAQTWPTLTLRMCFYSAGLPLSAAGGSLHPHHQDSLWDQTAAQTVQRSPTLWPHPEGNACSARAQSLTSRLVGVLWLRLFVFQDYNDHIAEISAKLVAIMDGLFEKALSKVCKALRCAAWLCQCLIWPWCVFLQYEVKAPMPSACFRNVCKQIAKMHEAIFELLPEEQTQVSLRAQTLSSSVFRIFALLCTLWAIHGWALMKVFFCAGAVSED